MKPTNSSPFQLPALPWQENALEPVISARTIGLHYGKHHATYVKKLNELVAGTRYAELPLEQVIAATAGNAETAKIFNNAAQTWNHTFFWDCLRPGGGGQPPRELARTLEQSFGDYSRFKEKFAQAAVDQFGSGWAWLVARGGKLEVISTSNAQTPITMGATPLLTMASRTSQVSSSVARQFKASTLRPSRRKLIPLPNSKRWMLRPPLTSRRAFRRCKRRRRP